MTHNGELIDGCKVAGWPYNIKFGSGEEYQVLWQSMNRLLSGCILLTQISSANKGHFWYPLSG